MATYPSLTPAESLPGPLLPPETCREDGVPRRCGVELEFAGLEPPAIARVVQSLYGGRVEVEHEHRVRVRDTSLGDFRVELDMLAAHPERKGAEVAGALEKLEQRLRATVGDVGSFVLPYEVACPPIGLCDLGELDPLAEALQRAGAKGTDARFFYAFGLHFNPEVARRDGDHILDVLKAYLLLSPWLREEMDIDTARQVAPFVQRFPEEYAALVVSPAYRPGLAELARDYVRHSPSRNRELDLWPLLTLLVPGEMGTGKASDPHVKPRPTWHWRLPDSRVGTPGWSILPDWNRWVQVERLATDRWALDELGALWLDCRRSGVLEDWPRLVRRWLPPV